MSAETISLCLLIACAVMLIISLVFFGDWQGSSAKAAKAEAERYRKMAERDLQWSPEEIADMRRLHPEGSPPVTFHRIGGKGWMTERMRGRNLLEMG